MKTGENDITNFFILKWIKYMVTLLKRYGFFTILKAIFLTLICILMTLLIYFIYNPDRYLTQIEKYNNNKHIEMIENKLESNYKINNLLNELLLKSKANRVIIGEYHNGMQNFEQIPFLKFSITFEKTASGILPIADQYKDVYLSRFNFPKYLFSKGYWYGNIDSLKLIDEHLYYKLKSNDAGYIAFIQIRGLNTDAGFLALSYKETPNNINLEEIGRLIRIYSQKIGIIISKIN